MPTPHVGLGRAKRASCRGARKLMAEEKRPLSVGFFFSLGHVKSGASGLHQWTNIVGTSVSGFFLYLIAGLNIVILVSIIRTCAKASSTTTSSRSSSTSAAS